MTNMQWLAALLSPRSVAPHPNFRSIDRITPAGLLALVVRGEGHDWRGFEDRLESPLETSERELIEAASASIHYETIEEGADRLSGLVHTKSVKDRALLSTAALLAATALSDMDKVDPTIRLLEYAARRIPNRTSDERLLSAALTQQRAMRVAEAGLPFERFRDKAHGLIEGVSVRDLSAFPVSEGSRWSAAGTNRQIVAAFKDSNRDLFDSLIGFPDTRTLKRMLRTDHSLLTAAMIRHAGSGKTAYVHETFSSFAMSSERSVRSEDPVDSPVWQSLTFFELVGHRRQARSLRSVLGQLRMMRSNGAVEATHEGLRLLRQAGDAKRHRLALNLVSGGGPLDALTREIHGVVTHRLSPEKLREGELATLESGAQLLDKRTARTAFSAVLAFSEEGPIASPFRRELRAVQLERMFKAAAALAPVARRVSEFASGVLASVERIGATDDQLLARAHERAMWPVDWDEVSEATKRRWRGWLDSPASAEGQGWDALANMLRPELRGEISTEVDSQFVISLDRIANELNAVMADSTASASSVVWLRDVAADVVVDRLRNARSEAGRGMFAMYAHNPADIAVALAQHADAEVWGELTEFLLDPRIPRQSKSAAIDRIASAPEKVPNAARQEFAGSAETLFGSVGHVSPFDPPEIDPFPAAVRLLAALRIASTDDTLSAIAVLAAGTTESKLEAARTLSTIVATVSPTPEWAIAIALQLSSDSNANVRAETGRTLAVALEYSTFANAVLVSRLMGLLAEDGLLVPLLVLRGLSGEVNVPPGPVAERVAHMADHHPVFGVRVQAGFVLKNSS